MAADPGRGEEHQLTSGEAEASSPDSRRSARFRASLSSSFSSNKLALPSPPLHSSSLWIVPRILSFLPLQTIYTPSFALYNPFAT